MKFPLVRLLGSILVFLTLQLGLLAASPSAAPDPLVGKWIWHHNILVEFKADGTATSDVNSNGVWEYLNNPEVQRKYRVTWDHGKAIDTVIHNDNGKTARLITQKIGKYDIRRATD